MLPPYLRAFAHAVPSTWNDLPRELCMFALSILQMSARVALFLGDFIDSSLLGPLVTYPLSPLDLSLSSPHHNWNSNLRN